MVDTTVKDMILGLCSNSAKEALGAALDCIARLERFSNYVGDAEVYARCADLVARAYDGQRTSSNDKYCALMILNLIEDRRMVCFDHSEAVKWMNAYVEWSRVFITKLG